MIIKIDDRIFRRARIDNGKLAIISPLAPHWVCLYCSLLFFATIWHQVSQSKLSVQAKLSKINKLMVCTILANKKSLELDYPRPEAVAFHPIHGFATANSKTLFRQSLITLTWPKGPGFLSRTKGGDMFSSTSNAVFLPVLQALTLKLNLIWNKSRELTEYSRKKCSYSKFWL